MSRLLAVLLILLAPAMAWTIPIWPPMDTPTFVAKSSDILIVRCINPDVLGGGKDDGLTLVEVEVVVVVKGDRKAGKTRLGTIGQPMEAGKRYLMASFGGNVFDTGFLAQSDQAVVEVPAEFDLKPLAGKTAVQQVQSIFDARRARVERLLKQLQREKKTLDHTVPKSGEKPAREITIDLGDGVTMTFVRIEPGEFLMGGRPDEKDVPPDARPQRRVKITRAYYLGKHEVTVGQFRKFVEQTKFITNDEKKRLSRNWRKTGYPQTDLYPVVCVTWYDAKEFCTWLQKHAKAKELGVINVRLPSEAEWEYACRAGTTTRYSSGDRNSDLQGYANVADLSKKRRGFWAAGGTEPWDDGFAYAAPVGHYKPNKWGLHDMHGNVEEWCEDYYGPYTHLPTTDPLRTSKTEEGLDHRICRGGNWQSPAAGALSYGRLHCSVDSNSPYSGTGIGFRVCIRLE